MRRASRWLAVAVLFWIGPAAAQRELAVNIVNHASAGTVRVNGVPIEQFAARPPFGKPTTTVIGIATWALNGDNTITVESRPLAPDGAIRVVIVGPDAREPKHDVRIDGAGTTSYPAKLEGLPRWAWLDAEAVTDAGRTLPTAVAALHRAYARRDFKAIHTVYQAAYYDLAQIVGPIAAEDMDEFARTIRSGKLAPLPTDLKVEGFYENRLFVVAGANGAPPIRIAATKASERSFESGRYWIRKQGRWYVVRF